MEISAKDHFDAFKGLRSTHLDDARTPVMSTLVRKYISVGLIPKSLGFWRTLLSCGWWISSWTEDKVEVESRRKCSPPAAHFHDVLADSTNSPPALPSAHPVLLLYLLLHLHLARPRHPGPASRRWWSIFFFIFIFLLLVHRQHFTLSTQRWKRGSFLDRYHKSLFLNSGRSRYQVNTLKKFFKNSMDLK